MLKKFPIYGFALIDRIGMPRYWAAVWTLIIGGSLAASTLKARLANIEAFYLHADSERKSGSLDDALGSVDLPTIEGLLEAYFVGLRNAQKVSTTAEKRWRDALCFVRDICERISRTLEVAGRFEDLRLRLERLDRMYGQLRTTSTRAPPSFVRALPARVTEEIYDAVTPDSKTNPFRGEATQWRVFAVFMLLLHQGLRRGEALSLPVDFLKSERTTLGTQFWMNVRSNAYEDADERHTTPAIKTAASIRQIPVSPRVATALMTYSENYRGKCNHAFLLTSMRRRPLSAEGVHYFFKRLTAVLSPTALQTLLDRTGMVSVSAHDLRHTAVVIRFRQFVAEGLPMDEALQRLRRYFGWSAKSSMPHLYAQAAFDERLMSTWSDDFDDRAAILLKWAA